MSSEIPTWTSMVKDLTQAPGERTRCFCATAVPVDQPAYVRAGWWLIAPGVYLVEVLEPDQVLDRLEGDGFQGVEWSG